MSSEVKADGAAYPSRDELVKAFEERRAALLEWFGSMSDEQLLEPIEGDLAQFAANKAMLMSTLSFHEGMHAGQISVARRAQGLPPLF